MIEVKVHSTLGRELPELARQLGKDIREVIGDETRLLADELVVNTPPFQSLGKKGGAKGAGDKAVKFSVERVIKVPEDLRVIKSPRDQRVKERVETLIRRRDVNALATVLPAIGQGFRDPGQLYPSLGGWHNRQRGRDGRVRRNAKVALSRPTERNRHRRELLARVGEAKGGWATALARFGGKPAAFIRRHSHLGTVLDRRTDKRNPKVVVINRAAHMAAIDARLGTVAMSVRNRRTKVAARVERVARANARKTQARINRR